MILRDPTVEAAVLETARGGILREGLGFDRCDVGAVLNISADHLGLRDIHTVEDLAAVKSVVVEAVHRDGTSVLNADDPLVADMRRHAGGRIVFFSMQGGDSMPDMLRHHLAEGGLAVVVETLPGDGEIVIRQDGRRLPLMRASDIPATLEGAAAFNVQNALAAIAMAYAHGIAMPVIRAAMTSFTSSFEQCPGRLNVHDGHGFRVILDYAHNPAGLAALGQVLRALRPRYRRLIGMVSIPGDRRDDDIREMGAIAAGLFDHIVLRETPDGRGRPPGEISGLLREGAIGAGLPASSIDAVLGELDAASACLKMALPGDLVVLLATSVAQLWNQVLSFEPDGGPVERRFAHAG